MTELTGTEKQIDFANDLRSRFFQQEQFLLTQIKEQMETDRPRAARAGKTEQFETDTAALLVRIEERGQALRSETSAKWWIDNAQGQFQPLYFEEGLFRSHLLPTREMSETSEGKSLQFQYNYLKTAFSEIDRKIFITQGNQK